MTREEIRKEMAVTLRDDMIIDKIYDDFESRTCEWKFDEDTIYSTSCHNMWQFTEGDLTDNGITYCPYCGHKIVSTDTKSHSQD